VTIPFVALPTIPLRSHPTGQLGAESNVPQSGDRRFESKSLLLQSVPAEGFAIRWFVSWQRSG
jgi:hypothetical protein